MFTTVDFSASPARILNCLTDQVLINRPIDRAFTEIDRLILSARFTYVHLLVNSDDLDAVLFNATGEILADVFAGAAVREIASRVGVIYPMVQDEVIEELECETCGGSGKLCDGQYRNGDYKEVDCPDCSGETDTEEWKFSAVWQNRR